ncbi:MAG: protein TolQ [bacterium]
MNSLFLMQMALISQAEGPDLSTWNLVMGAGPVVKLVIFILVVFSLVSWAIIGAKLWQIWRAKKESRMFLNAFWAGESLEQVRVSTKRFQSSPLAYVFRAGMSELETVRKGGKSEDSGSLWEMGKSEWGAENVERALRQSSSIEMNRLSRFLSFLATTGSTTPFIGLFGTVWGIMNSFQAIGGKGGAGFNVVGKGISEALIATALGLAAAIPAVVAYNYFLTVLRAIQSELENFQAEFMNIVERHFIKKRQEQKRQAPQADSPRLRRERRE